MTSQQVMLFLVGCLAAGCVSGPKSEVTDDRPNMVLAIVPLRNDSGTLHADGLALADKLAQVLEQTPGIDVLAVNRTLEAMDRLELTDITSGRDAARLAKAMKVDGVVVGAVTAWDPYDPPAIGLQLELFRACLPRAEPAVDLRRLTQASTGSTTVVPTAILDAPPEASVSAVLRATDPDVVDQLRDYAYHHGGNEPFAKPWWQKVAIRNGVASPGADDARLYRISMDLYARFVCHEMGRRLIAARAVNAAVPPPQLSAAAP